jgi:PAS domain S-box-containing protein
VLAGLVLLFGLFLHLGVVLGEEAGRRMAAERLTIAEHTVAYLDQEFEEAYQQLERGAAAIDRHRGDLAAQRQTLDDLLRPSEPFVTSSFMISATDQVLWTDASDLQSELIGHDLTAAREALETRARYASPAAGTPRQPSVLFAVAVRGETGTLAILGARIDATEATFRTLIKAVRNLAEGGHAELVDQELGLILSTESGHALSPAEHPTFYAPLMARHRSGVGLTDPVGEEDPDPLDRGQRHVMAFVPLETVPWGLGLGGTEAGFTAAADTWRWHTLPLAGVALLITLFLVLVTRRSVVAPLRMLAQTARRMAEGDLNTPVPRLGQGEVRELAESFNDMRERLQRALDALAVESSRHQGIVHSLTDAVLTTDSHRRIESINPAAAALTGWPASEAIGRQITEVLGDANGLVPEPPADKPPPRGGTTKGALSRRDGRSVEVAVARSPIVGQAGELKGTIYVLRDITAEEELTRLKDQLLATVSHELRSPIGIVKGYALTLLQPGWSAETQTQSLQTIIEASDELQELVEKLLDMSMIGAGVLSIDTRRTKLGPLVRAVAERANIRSTGRIGVVVPTRLPAVLADARRIEQVLYNLVDNAIKYSPDGGTIAIEVRVAYEAVEVRVSDEGFGVTSEDLQNLFQRFQRGSAAQGRHIRGAGLGLAICKGIIDAHGGRIWVERPVVEPGAVHARGTSFCFTLPVAHARQTSAPRRGPPARTAAGALSPSRTSP